MTLRALVFFSVLWGLLLIYVTWRVSELAADDRGVAVLWILAAAAVSAAITVVVVRLVGGSRHSGQEAECRREPGIWAWVALAIAIGIAASVDEVNTSAAFGVHGAELGVLGTLIVIALLRSAG
jgi:hypothetical protein